MLNMRNSGSADSHVIAYRSDLDGLRAIAVLSVVFFHLLRASLPGGFVGVDMFFVLSGYFITSIIWREAREGSFSLVRFYDRRIRRLMPALIVLLVVTSAVSLALLLPADLIGYSKSLFATLIFVANIYFWRDIDYFSPNAEEKPLLHLWSLGVEEQFYILFPFILILLARCWRAGAVGVVTALTLASLALNILALHIGGGSPAFFLLPTRGWELGIGAVLALRGATPHASRSPLNAAAIAGVLLIVLDIWRPLREFPLAPVALPAVVGTALLVYSGPQSWVNRLLSSPPLVFIGLISYSLYLWHWPCIVFGRYYLVRDFTRAEVIAALLVMLACAVASWRYVERPFRSAKMCIKTVRLAALAGVIPLAIMAALLLKANGMPGRLNAAAAQINVAVGTNYRCPVAEYVALGISRACLMNLPSGKPADADVILLGNSHAQMYAPVWRSILQARGLTGLLVPLNLCLPTVIANVSADCIAAARRNLTEVSKLTHARTVVLGLTWDQAANDLVDANGHVLDNTSDQALVVALDDLIERLHRVGKSAVLIGPIAEPGWDVASIVSRQLAFGHTVDRPTSIPERKFQQRFGAIIEHFENRTDIGFARPDKVQCTASACYYLLNGQSLFSDSTHVATDQLYRFRTLFETALR
jgi:peptidoglycan/LPS O-acetylase OafA/YrhL